MKTLGWWLGGGLAAAGVAGLVLAVKGAAEGRGPGEEAQQLLGGGRTPQDILDAVARVDPEGNATLQRGYLGQPNWCNRAVMLFARELGVPMIWGEWGTRANDQISWLDAGNDGWYQLANGAAAQQLALAGGVALATYYNLAPGGSGHMALVLPLEGPIQIAQAGAKNFNRGTVAAGFGAIQPTYYGHS